MTFDSFYEILLLCQLVKSIKILQVLGSGLEAYSNASETLSILNLSVINSCKLKLTRSATNSPGVAG